MKADKIIKLAGKAVESIPSEGIDPRKFFEEGAKFGYEVAETNALKGFASGVILTALFVAVWGSSLLTKKKPHEEEKPLEDKDFEEETV